MTNRLFISFDIPDQIQNDIIELRNELFGGSSIRWEKKDKLHITAKFLGDTDASLIPRITDCLREVSGNHSKISARFFRFGLFYKNNKPKILWLGLKENHKIVELFDDIEEGMFRLGFGKEKRKFKPHLTILRIKGNEDINKIKKMTTVDIDPINFEINQISLIKSELKPTGSVYSIVQSFKLS